MQILKNIGTIIVILALVGSLLVGYKLGRNSVHCDTITTSVEYIHDTISYYIHDSIPNPIKDTLFYPDTIPQNIDTLAILKEYYAIYNYDWTKQDSNINIALTTTVTQNKPIKYNLKYDLLKPITIINNTQQLLNCKNNHIYIGTTMPVISKELMSMHPGIDVIYSNQILYTGLMYQPYKNTFSIKLGFNIFSF